MKRCGRTSETNIRDTGRTHPNVLLILTDDQGWGDIRSHGNDQIDTPVLDRLAEEGARFDRFYVSPLCAPTRASLLAGRYHLRTGVWGVTKGREVMRAEEVTMAEAFKQAGYATGCLGKWHNGEHYPHHPNGKGFDEFFGFCAGHWTNYFDTRLERNGEEVETEGYISDVLTDEALAFVEKNRDRPFFCYLPYNAPHGPYQVPDVYFDKYKARGVGDTTACIYAMCENIDDNVGRLLAKLDELGLAEDTLVLFLSDNGPAGVRYNGGMRGGKGSVHEGGSRVPLFVRWPGRVRPGTVVRPIAAHIDLLPTLVDLCGIDMPETLPFDGVSLRPLLEGREEGWPERALFTHRTAWDGPECPGPAEGAVRTPRHRFVYTSKGCELYDMAADPGQTTDISEDEPGLLAKLRGAYEAFFADVTGGQSFARISVPVCYERAPVVRLEAPLADLSGGLQFKFEHGWAHDWLTNWRSTGDAASWRIDVIRPGSYEVALMYACSEQDVGGRLRVEVGDSVAEAVVETAHDPDPIPSPSRAPYSVAPEKEWAVLVFPPVELKEGQTALTVRAADIPGAHALDLKAARLRPLRQKRC